MSLGRVPDFVSVEANQGLGVPASGVAVTGEPTLQDLQEDLDASLRFSNEGRSHQGYRTQGRTPWQAFQDGVAAMSQPQAA